MSTVRLKITLAYQGTRFKGWQIQAHKDKPHPRTVQACIQQAVGVVVNDPSFSVHVVGSGRTDAGVHAEGQVAHTDIPEKRKDIDWQQALNGLLPKDVSVLKVDQVPQDFHAVYSAKYKIYTYRLWKTRRYVIPQRRHFVWAAGPLDEIVMEAAAASLVGRHDFESFRNQGGHTKTTVRNLMSVIRKPVMVGNESNEEVDGFSIYPEEVWEFKADGFLKQMVRNLMGCLVEVGKGRMEPDRVETILQARDRTQAPATAPPQGLTLKHVVY